MKELKTKFSIINYCHAESTSLHCNVDTDKKLQTKNVNLFHVGLGLVLHMYK